MLAYGTCCCYATTTATGNLRNTRFPIDQSQSVSHVVSQNTLSHFRISQITHSLYSLRSEYRQLNSTSNYRRRWLTPQCPHLSSQYYISNYHTLISWTDLSPIPVKSAVKSYLTTWCIQNLSRRALKRLTVSTSTTVLGRLFQILTIRAEKNIYINQMVGFCRVTRVSRVTISVSVRIMVRFSFCILLWHGSEYMSLISMIAVIVNWG